MKEGLQLIRDKLVRVLASLAKFADQYKALPTPGLHPLPGRPDGHRGQAGHLVDERTPL